jgi:hypothetical protein
MMKNYHFWYSAKQAQRFALAEHWGFEPRPVNYATIGGEVVCYTSCSADTEHGCSWDDMVYLGQGDYSHSSGDW